MLYLFYYYYLPFQDENGDEALTEDIEEVNKILKSFTSFSELWEKEPEPSVKEYFAEGPLMVDLEAKYRNFKVNYFVGNHMFVVGFLLKSKF